MDVAVSGLPALPPGLTAPRFPPTSRYATTEVAVHTDATGRDVPYLRRRLLPDPQRLAEAGTHVVEDGERTDTIAAAVFGEPLLSWRLLDGNPALHPRELVRLGRRLRVTQSAGMPGVFGA